MLRQSDMSVSPPRRRLLSFIGIGCLAGTSLWLTRKVKATEAPPQLSSESILQPDARTPDNFIERAFEMRQLAIDYGDQAYGAVIVRDNLIFGQSWSRVVLDGDPTGHAEMSALRDAARRNGRQSLFGATLFSTSRACSMCEAAAGWVGISSMIHGRSLDSAGRPHSCSRG